MSSPALPSLVATLRAHCRKWLRYPDSTTCSRGSIIVTRCNIQYASAVREERRSLLVYTHLADLIILQLSHKISFWNRSSNTYDNYTIGTMLQVNGAAIIRSDSWTHHRSMAAQPVKYYDSSSRRRHRQERHPDTPSFKGCVTLTLHNRRIASAAVISGDTVDAPLQVVALPW